MKDQSTRGRIIRTVATCVALSLSQTQAAILCVQTNGDDSAAGADWAKAKRTVGGALAAARAGDEIWVAVGRFPECITITNDVALFGGFKGDEATREARNWLTNETVLDGCTNGVVVTMQGGGPNTILDGFTIENGRGSGVACVNSGCTIRNNFIRSNLGSSVLAYGGGIYVRGTQTNGAPVIEFNRITDNYTSDGGGIACIDASPRIAHNVIAWNTAQQNGGGISCWRNSSPEIANNVIVGNTASWLSSSPVPVGGGGVFATADDLDGRPHPTAISAPRIVNNAIVANGAWKGGGLALVDSNGGIPSVVNNTIVANNGSGIYWASSSLPLVGTIPVIRNTIVAYNRWGLERADGTPADTHIEFNCIFGNGFPDQSPEDYRGLPNQTGINSNISSDPQLVNYRIGNIHLLPTSPCINAGITTADLAAAQDLDERGRVEGAAVDIGADEFDGTGFDSTVPVVYVSSGGSDAQEGRSWATAKKSVQAGIDAARQSAGEVWVQSGTYSEHVLVPAFVYLYGGFSGTENTRDLRDVQAHPTILDGGGVAQIVTCRNAGYLVSAVDGFTIQNGGQFTGGAGLNKFGAGGFGGGVYVGVASPYLSGNRITHNSLAFDNRPVFPQSPSYGAGIYCDLSYAIISGNSILENEILNDFDGRGAGVYCTRSGPIISDNQIVRNQALEGAAIYADTSTPRIVGNLIRSNAFYDTSPLPLYLGARSGAITLALAQDFLIARNTIRDNTAAVGAGVSIQSAFAGRIENNLVLGNRAYDPTAGGGMGGGIYCLATTQAVANLWIVNNTMVGNVASNWFGEQGGAIAISVLPPSTNLVIANNLLVSNSSGIFQTLTTPMGLPTLLANDLLNVRSNYINLAAGSTDLSRDPLFADSQNEDYHLQLNSPCIDAGSVLAMATSDKDGISRPLDGNNDGVPAPDIGAYEFVHPGADSDGDGMPDVWEIACRLNPVESDASLDPDGDGATSGNEFMAGTDPQDPTSVFCLRCRSETQGGLTLQWNSIIGRSYALERCSSLTGALWETVATDLTGNGTVLEYRDPAPSASSRFYRIKAW